MSDENEFKEYMYLYQSKNSAIRNLFWKRLEKSIELADISNDSKILDIGCSRAICYV